MVGKDVTLNELSVLVGENWIVVVVIVIVVNLALCWFTGLTSDTAAIADLGWNLLVIPFIASLLGLALVVTVFPIVVVTVPFLEWHLCLWVKVRTILVEWTVLPLMLFVVMIV